MKKDEKLIVKMHGQGPTIQAEAAYSRKECVAVMLEDVSIRVKNRKFVQKLMEAAHERTSMLQQHYLQAKDSKRVDDALNIGEDYMEWNEFYQTLVDVFIGEGREPRDSDFETTRVVGDM